MVIEFPVMDGLTFDPSLPLYWHRGRYAQISQAETSRWPDDVVLQPVQWASDNNGKTVFGLSGPLYVDPETGILYRVIKREDGRLSLAYREAPREYLSDLVCACGTQVVRQVHEDGVQDYSCPICDTRRYHGR